MSTPTAGGELHEVRLIDVPVALHARSQERTAELIREMYLIEQARHQQQEAEGPEHELPRRLMQLIDALTGQYSGFTARQDSEMVDAIGRDLVAIEQVYRVPESVGDAALRLRDMLDEVDEYCRQGQHLLTLATPPELVRYRHWYLSEFANQLAGGSPTSWPEFVGRDDRSEISVE